MKPILTYPAIREHGLIGDRRTAALVAADGTIDWLCLPHFDGTPVFGALLDADLGGFWRFGPREITPGRQSYRGNSAVLVTRWERAGAILELTDFMACPDFPRMGRHEGHRLVVRKLSCLAGKASCTFRLEPRDGFTEVTRPYRGQHMDHVAAGPLTLGVWVSVPSEIDDTGIGSSFELLKEETAWAVLELNNEPQAWGPDKAQHELESTLAYWHGYASSLTYPEARPLVMRSALVGHMLGYAPEGSMVAALTSSLPERVGGDLNWDYRFCWIRDTSLAMTMLARLGDMAAPERFLRWLSGLGSMTPSPLQVVYRIDGTTQLSIQELPELTGYLASRPVRFGNRAAKQRQLDSLGYLADFCWTYLQLGGKWQAIWTELVDACARYVVDAWQQPDSGIWELPRLAHYVSSKVMAWVTLDRACRIHAHLGMPPNDSYRTTMNALHAEVLEKGWNARKGCFTQAYDSDALDASALLIPLFGFLPPDDSRVSATLDRIVETLSRNGYVYRFDDPSVVDEPPIPMGEYEGSFWACTFWLAQAFVMTNQEDRAKRILDRAEKLAGTLGMLSEMYDPLKEVFLGNTPQLFSHATYVTAVLELEARAQVRQEAG